MLRPGRIIFLNGTSSSGKSTLAEALRPKLEPQFCFYSSDQLADTGFRPKDEPGRSLTREQFFNGFHRSIPAFAAAGIDLLIEHIVEEENWTTDLNTLLAGLDVFWVGVHATLSELEKRERSRGNRDVGEAKYHLKTHAYCKYDIEVDSMRSLDLNTNLIVQAWRARQAAK